MVKKLSRINIIGELSAETCEIIGGVVGGIGMALLEETVSDQTGRIINASFGDYLMSRTSM